MIQRSKRSKTRTQESSETSTIPLSNVQSTVSTSVCTSTQQPPVSLYPDSRKLAKLANASTASSRTLLANMSSNRPSKVSCQRIPSAAYRRPTAQPSTSRRTSYMSQTQTSSQSVCASSRIPPPSVTRKVKMVTSETSVSSVRCPDTRTSRRPPSGIRPPTRSGPCPEGGARASGLRRPSSVCPSSTASRGARSSVRMQTPQTRKCPVPSTRQKAPCPLPPSEEGSEDESLDEFLKLEAAMKEKDNCAPDESIIGWFDRAVETEMNKRQSLSPNISVLQKLEESLLGKSGHANVTINQAVSASSGIDIENRLRSTPNTELTDAVDKLMRAQAIEQFQDAVYAAEKAAEMASPDQAEEAAAAAAQDMATMIQYQADITGRVKEVIPGIKPIEVLGYIGITKPKLPIRPYHWNK